jgi:DNA polymerase-3 subunit beta
MDEKYPDYMAIVPKNDVKLSVNRTELIAAIKRVLEFSNKTSRQINLSGNLQISSEDTAYKQKAIEKITCEGGLIEINVNGQFLSDALSHFGSEIVEINWQAPDKAIVINEPGDGDNFVMVMAMVNV